MLVPTEAEHSALVGIELGGIVEQVNVLGLFKNVQMQDARAMRNETYFVHTSQ